MDKRPFELWDTETANLLDTYRTEEEALADVAEAVRRHGVERVGNLLLGREDADGRSEVIAKGAALAERAMTPSVPR